MGLSRFVLIPAKSRHPYQEFNAFDGDLKSVAVYAYQELIYEVLQVLVKRPIRKCGRKLCLNCFIKLLQKPLSPTNSGNRIEIF